MGSIMEIVHIKFTSEEELRKTLEELFRNSSPNELKIYWGSTMKSDLKDAFQQNPNFAATFSGSTCTVAKTLIRRYNIEK